MSLQIVQQVRAKYPTPLGAQHGACLVAMAQALGHGAGLLAKDYGTFVILENGTKVAQDIICYPTGQIYDCLGDGEGQAIPQWSDAGMVDASRYVPVAGSTVPQEPPPLPDNTAGLLTRVAALEAICRALNDQQARQQDSIDKANEALLHIQGAHGLPVEVSGKVNWQDAVYGRKVTWTGKVL